MSGSIESCVDCWNGSANASIMWPCLPVPVFGDPYSGKVKVATIGLNPSYSEWIDKEYEWKVESQRLPVVMDHGITGRDQISGDMAKKAQKRRCKYFSDPSRAPHKWFSAFDDLFRTLSCGWSYQNGSAVHIDIVACPTWKYWNELSNTVKDSMKANCQKHFTKSMMVLPDGAQLFVDGRTAFDALNASSFQGAVDNDLEETLGGWQPFSVWKGAMKMGGKRFPFIAWSLPINRIKDKSCLVQWISSSY